MLDKFNVNEAFSMASFSLFLFLSLISSSFHLHTEDAGDDEEEPTEESKSDSFAWKRDGNEKKK